MEAHPSAHPGRRSTSFLMKRPFMLGQWDINHTFSSKTPSFHSTPAACESGPQETAPSKALHFT